jgi:hypothetical protein
MWSEFCLKSCCFDVDDVFVLLHVLHLVSLTA